jgi:hypothetical protein
MLQWTEHVAMVEETRNTFRFLSWKMSTWKVEKEMDETGLGLCPLVGFGICSVEPSGSAT